MTFTPFPVVDVLGTTLALIFPLGVACSAIVIRSSLTFMQRAALAFGLGASINMTIWIWLYLLGGESSNVLTVVTVLNASALVVLVLKRRRRQRQQTTTATMFGSLAVMAGLGLVAAVFYVVPRTVDGEITARQIMGPDAVGYANAIAGLVEDGSFWDLENAAVGAAGESTVDALFDQETRSVYRIIDKSLSLKTEFIIGAYRIGFPGIVASVVKVVGLSHLYLAMYLLVALSLAAGSFLIFGLLRSFKVSILLSMAVTSMSMININLLVGFHEGGVVQAFMYLSLAAFLCGSLQDEISRLERSMFFSIALVFAVTSYLDMFYVYLVIAGFYFVIARLLKSPQGTRRARDFAVVAIVVLVMLTPLALRIPDLLLRRLADARQGGWAWDSWPELTSILGVTNPYGSPPDSILAQLVLLGIVITIAQAVRTSIRRVVHLPITVFACSIVGVTGSFYIYSRYLMDHTNYQWFKLLGTIIGPSALVIIVLFLARSTQSQSVSPLINRALFGFAGVLIAFASLSYIRYFRGESLHLRAGTIEQSARPELREVSKQFILFGRYDWQEFALTPFLAGNFATREDQRITPLIPKGRPVALLIKDDYCPDWDCLKGISQSAISDFGVSYRLLNLNMQSDDLRGLSPYMQWRKINASVVNLGSLGIDQRYESPIPSLDHES